MNTSGECAGKARRRSPRLHRQIKASEESAGMAPRRSPRLNPPIQASEIGIRRIRRRRRTSLAGPSCMPDDDDMLREILVRLPPEPSSLPRASAVCKRWLGLVSDPKFHRQFHQHHQKPPILGFFAWDIDKGIVFNSILDPPDRIPHARFSVARYMSNDVLDCRHGRVLLGDCHWKKMVLVCDPITGEQQRVAFPSDFKSPFFKGAVLCAASNHGHVHGSCHSSPFKVVLFCKNTSGPFVRVYSSETGRWGNLISTAAPFKHSADGSTLIGNRLYWLYGGRRILELDLDGQGRLSVIMGPPVTNDQHYGRRRIIKAEDGAVGYAILSYPRFQTWQSNINGHGLATWVPWKTIEMDSILGLSPHIEQKMGQMKNIKGYDEGRDVIFFGVNGSVYMVQLRSMQSQKLSCGTLIGCCHPFKSFYTSAIRGCDEAEVVHDS